jgi:hypothetical protein
MEIITAFFFTLHPWDVERSKESRVLSAFVSATPKYLLNMNLFEIRKENQSEQSGRVTHLRSTTVSAQI